MPIYLISRNYYKQNTKDDAKRTKEFLLTSVSSL